MPSTSNSHRTPRAETLARARILATLKEDHQRVKKSYREFQKLDRNDDPVAGEAIVRQVLHELTVHAALEEELLYPAARDSIRDEERIDEAEVEHESMHNLIEQLRNMSADTEKFTARFTVLCEYVLHHVKEEEGEIFPQLTRTRLEWERMAAAMDKRRLELAPVANAGSADGADSEPADARTTAKEDKDMAPPEGGSRREHHAGSRRASAPRRP